jgi:hypothetical protein
LSDCPGCAPQCIRICLNETGAKSVSIIAYGMGNQLLLQVLRSLGRSKPEMARINQIILVAPQHLVIYTPGLTQARSLLTGDYSVGRRVRRTSRIWEDSWPP